MRSRRRRGSQQQTNRIAVTTLKLRGSADEVLNAAWLNANASVCAAAVTVGAAKVIHVAHQRCAGGAEEKKCAKIAENPQPKYAIDSSGRLTWSPCYHHSCTRPWLAAHAAWAGEGGTYVAGAG